jgi:hypothetical protein
VLWDYVDVCVSVYFTYFEKIKGSLCDHAAIHISVLSVYPSIIYSFTMWFMLCHRKVNEYFFPELLFTLSHNFCAACLLFQVFTMQHITVSDILPASHFKWNVSLSARVQQCWSIPGSADLHTAHQSAVATGSSSMEVKVPSWSNYFMKNRNLWLTPKLHVIFLRIYPLQCC